ncbi:hypothetical protein DYB32_010829, partial [Aphanomyces invadans]
VEARQATFSPDQATLMKSYAKEYATVDVFDTYMHANEIACDTPTSVRGSTAGNDLFQDFDYNHLTRLSASSSSDSDAHAMAGGDPDFDIQLLRPDVSPKHRDDDAVDDENGSNHSSSTIVATSSEDDLNSPVHLTTVHHAPATTTTTLFPVDCNVTML